MRQEVLAFFGQMYGLDEPIVEEQILPSLKGNVQ
jgi:hypothetical protein